MDGMIFLRGAFIDSSIKNIVLFLEDSKGKITTVKKISSLSEVNELLVKHNCSKIYITQVIYDRESKSAKVYCNIG